jgi:mono/diheme cytochrome c family protein
MKKKKCLSESLKMVTLSFFLAGGYNFVHAQTRPWVVPNDALNVKNPIAKDPSSIAIGKTLYKTQCSPCHGDKGKGDGPASAALNPKPADHTSAALQAESDALLFYKISEGRNPMPGFKDKLKASDRWALINYIRTLSKKSK